MVLEETVMNGMDRDALAGLAGAIEALLPEPSAPSVQFTPLIVPMQLAPTGLGGFVGINADHEGEVFGRRLKATVLITVQANDIGSVNDSVSAVTGALLGTDRKELLQQGVLRVVLDEIGDQVVSGRGTNEVVRRTLVFGVLYEFLKEPEEPEGVILEIPVNLDTS